MQPTPFRIDQFASSTRLPSLPNVAAKLIELAQQEDPDFAEVSRAIQSDPVISGKVMTTVNSALFGFRPKVETIRDAVNKLGVNMIRTLLLSFHLARHKPGQPDLEPQFQRHWRSSLTQAVIAELIAEQIKQEPASCFLAAMVQDIGSLAMLSEAPRPYLENILKRHSFPNVATAERNVFGFSHVDVSIAIIKKWGLSDRFENAIRHHQVPQKLKPVRFGVGDVRLFRVQGQTVGCRPPANLFPSFEATWTQPLKRFSSRATLSIKLNHLSPFTPISRAVNIRSVHTVASREALWCRQISLLNVFCLPNIPSPTTYVLLLSLLHTTPQRNRLSGLR